MNRPTILLLFWLAAALPLFGVEPGEKAPPFANPDLSSRHVLSRDYLGRGWLIVDFFCKKELPVLERLHRSWVRGCPSWSSPRMRPASRWWRPTSGPPLPR